MLSRKEIKQTAREMCDGNRLMWWFVYLGGSTVNYVLTLLVSAICTLPFIIDYTISMAQAFGGTPVEPIRIPPFVTMLVIGVPMILGIMLNFSFTSIALNLYDCGSFDADNVGYGFKHPLQAFGISFFTGLFTMLWSMLFIIPGIIKSYSYAMAPYIKLDNPDLSPNKCLKESSLMMKGHKMRLFIFSLSFIPWFLTIPLTFGLSMIYFLPYMQVSMAGFYRELKESYNDVQPLMNTTITPIEAPYMNGAVSVQIDPPSTPLPEDFESMD